MQNRQNSSLDKKIKFLQKNNYPIWDYSDDNSLFKFLNAVEVKYASEKSKEQNNLFAGFSSSEELELELEKFIFKKLIDEEWEKFKKSKNYLSVKDYINEKDFEKSFRERFTSIVNDADNFVLNESDQSRSCFSLYLQTIKTLKANENILINISKKISIGQNNTTIFNFIESENLRKRGNGRLIPTLDEFKKFITNLYENLFFYDKDKDYKKIIEEIDKEFTWFLGYIHGYFTIYEQELLQQISLVENAEEKPFKEEEGLKKDSDFSRPFSYDADEADIKAIDVAIADKAEFEEIKNLICEKLNDYIYRKKNFILINIGPSDKQKMYSAVQVMKDIRTCNTFEDIEKALNSEHITIIAKKRRWISTLFSDHKSDGQKLQDTLLDLVRPHLSVNNSPALGA